MSNSAAILRRRRRMQGTESTITVDTAPAISGTPEVTETLTRTAGSYSGDGTVTVTNGRWQRDRADIPGETSATYLLTDSDDEKTIRWAEDVEDDTNSGTYYSSGLFVTYAAPVAAGGLSDQSYTEDTGDQTYDVSSDFTGSGGTWSLPTTISGVTINSSGVVTFATDVLALQSGTSIVARYTNSGGFADSGFSLSITEAVAAPVQSSPLDTSGAPSTLGTEFDVDCTAYGLVTAAGADPNAATIKAGTGPLADSGAATASTPVDLDFDLSGESKGDFQVSIVGANAGGDSNIVRADIEYITVPGTMSAPTVTATGETSISVEQAADPADTGGRTITSYDLRWQEDGGSWTTVTGISDPESITSLTADTLYNVQTRAVNSVGAGAWSASGSDTTDAPTGYTPVYQRFTASEPNALYHAGDLTGAPATITEWCGAIVYEVGAGDTGERSFLHTIGATNYFADWYVIGKQVGIKSENNANALAVYCYTSSAITGGKLLALFSYDGTNGFVMRTIDLDNGTVTGTTNATNLTGQTFAPVSQTGWALGAKTGSLVQPLDGQLERLQLWMGESFDPTDSAVQQWFVEANLQDLKAPTVARAQITSDPILDFRGSNVAAGTNNGTGSDFATYGTWS